MSDSGENDFDSAPLSDNEPTIEEAAEFPQDTSDEKEAPSGARENTASSPASPKNSEKGADQGLGHTLKRAAQKTGRAFNNGMKNDTPESAGDSTILQKAQDLGNNVRQKYKKTKRTIQNVGKSIKAIFATVTNPNFWLGVLIVGLVGVGILSTFTATQVYGQVAVTTNDGGSVSAAASVLSRLAQRAEWLRLHAAESGDTAASVLSITKAQGATYTPQAEGNSWDVACPNIVALIWGEPPNGAAANGGVNATANYNSMVAAGLEPIAWMNIDGVADNSGGYTLTNPPPGAIVSGTGSTGYGHTWVVLTESGRVIDNTYTIDVGKTTDQPDGFETYEEWLKYSTPTSWVLPPMEGFEGNALTGDFDGGTNNTGASAVNDLPEVPDWATSENPNANGSDSSSGVPTASGDGTTADSAKTMAYNMLANYNWKNDKEWTCLDKLWTRESSWSYTASNSSSGAYGIPQALPGSKMGTGWQTDPKVQISWGLSYIESRYGSPCQAWAHSESTDPHWY